MIEMKDSSMFKNAIKFFEDNDIPYSLKNIVGEKGEKLYKITAPVHYTYDENGNYVKITHWYS